MIGSAPTRDCAQRRSFWRIDDLPGRPEVDRFCRCEDIADPAEYAPLGILIHGSANLATPKRRFGI
ncbi:MAG: hypothetical protein ACLPKE_28790, partial [Streptosporangiaceae bacterium]